MVDQRKEEGGGW